MLVKITIDGTGFEVKEGEVLLETCLKLSLDIPSLCYLSGALPNGRCGVCVVEVDGKTKLSCAVKTKNGQVIKTNSPEIIEKRKSALAKILELHEVNCFTCAKSGFCQLQKLIARFEMKSNFKSSDHKKISLTNNLTFEPNKCIGCNRCVSFCNSISTNKQKTVNDITSAAKQSNIMENVVDFCPTVALFNSTSPGKLAMTNVVEKDSFDTSDVFMPAIRVSLYDGDIINIRSSGKILIKDETKFVYRKVKNRPVCPTERYDEVRELMRRYITSRRSEKNVFMIGDSVSLELLTLINSICERFDNCIAVFDSYEGPLPVCINKDALIKKKEIVFIGEIEDNIISAVRCCAVTAETFAFSSTENFLKEMHKFSDPYLCIGDGVDHDYFAEFENTCYVNTKPSNLWRKDFPEMISIAKFKRDYNHHDINFVYIAGETNRSYMLPSIPIIHHCLFDNRQHDFWLADTYFLEEDGTYLDIFSNLVSAKKILHSSARSKIIFIQSLFEQLGQGYEFKDMASVHARKNDTGTS